MAKVGSAYIAVIPSMDGFADAVKGELNAIQAESAQDKGKKGGFLQGILGDIGGLKMLAGGALAGAGAAAAAVGKMAFDAYSDYEQLAGGVETLFADGAGIVKANAEQAFRTAGISANEYMAQANQLAGTLMRSTGGNAKEAANLADTALKDMADNAAKTGTDLGVLQEAYASLSRGNYEMLDSLGLGYAGTKTGLQDLINDANKLRAAQGLNADLTIDEYGDIITAVHMLQQEMNLSGTAAAESATTISGSLGMLGAAWSNLLAGFGRDDADMGQLINNLVGSIGDVLANAVPRILQIVGSIGSSLPQVINGLAGTLGNAFAQAMPAVLQMVSGFFDNLPALIASLIGVIGNLLATGIPALLAICATILTKLPGLLFSLIVNVIPALLGALGAVASSVLMGALGYLGIILGSIISWFSSVFGVVGGALSALAGSVSAKAGEIWAGFMNTLTVAWENVSAFFASIPERIMGFFSGAGGWLADSGRALIDGFLGGLTSVWDKAMNTVGGFIQGIRDFFPFSPAKKGPLSGQGYTTYSGAALVRDFAKSITAASGQAFTASRGVATEAARGMEAPAPSYTAAPVYTPKPAAELPGNTYNIYIDGAQLSTRGVDKAVEDFMSRLAYAGALDRR